MKDNGVFEWSINMCFTRCVFYFEAPCYCPVFSSLFLLILSWWCDSFCVQVRLNIYPYTHLHVTSAPTVLPPLSHTPHSACVVNPHPCVCVWEAGVQAERSQRLDSQKAVCNSICNLGTACHLPRLSSGVTLSISFSLIQFSSRKHLTLPSAELFLSAKRVFFFSILVILTSISITCSVTQGTSWQKPSQYFAHYFTMKQFGHHQLIVSKSTQYLCD